MYATVPYALNLVRTPNAHTANSKPKAKRFFLHATRGFQATDQEKLEFEIQDLRIRSYYSTWNRIMIEFSDWQSDRSSHGSPAKFRMSTGHRAPVFLVPSVGTLLVPSVDPVAHMQNCSRTQTGRRSPARGRTRTWWVTRSTRSLSKRTSCSKTWISGGWPISACKHQPSGHKASCNVKRCRC